MKKHTTSGAVLLLVATSAFFILARSFAQPPTDDKTGVSEYRYSDPYTYKNLTVYIIRGKDRIPAKSYLTLEQAMDRKLITVFETGSVNELSVENQSDNEAIFIQSGDIVKGGRQDRTLAFDMIVPPKSGKIAINSFCVEHGRWSGRGNESAAAFHSSNDQIASKQLKLAAKYENNQSNVWNNVSKMQDKLKANVGMAAGGVLAPESESSLQLSLENKKVRENVEAYLDKLLSATEGKSDAIGFVFFINGKLNSADAYGSHDLFIRLWKKLLKASATEAVADLGEKGDLPVAPTIKAFTDCIAETAKAESSDRTINERTKMTIHDAQKSLLFETHDTKLAEVVHSNYLTKDENTLKPDREIDIRE